LTVILQPQFVGQTYILFLTEPFPAAAGAVGKGYEEPVLFKKDST